MHSTTTVGDQERPKGRLLQFAPHFQRRRAASAASAGASATPPATPSAGRPAVSQVDRAAGAMRKAVRGVASPEASFEEEAVRAKSLFDWAGAYVRHAWNAAEGGRQVDCLEAGLLVDELFSSLSRNSAAAVSLTRLGQREGYGQSHAVNTAVLSMICGRALGMPRAEIISMGLAGLHLDLGMARMPAYIVDKPGRLKSWEFALVKQHAQESCKVLRTGGEVRGQVQKAILDHHERHDGLGYPNGLLGRSISQCGRIVAMADAFDAMTSERAYREAFSPTRALGFIYQQAGRQFHPSLAQWFVRSMGVYPAGSLVLLSDGRLAVVRGARRGQPLKPEVMVIFDEQCKPCPPRLLDLTDPAQADGVTILRCLEPRRFGLEPGALYTMTMQAAAVGQA